MYEREISDKLKKALRKPSKKDKVRYDATLNKIEEILQSPNIFHYKNLRYDFNEFKRVHIDSNFVLIFKIEGMKIKFEDLEHHDKIYRR